MDAWAAGFIGRYSQESIGVTMLEVDRLLGELWRKEIILAWVLSCGQIL